MISNILIILIFLVVVVAFWFAMMRPTGQGPH